MVNRSSREDDPDDIAYYGLDPGGPTPIEEMSSVEVNDIDCPIASAQADLLNQIIDPLAESREYSIEIYTQALATIYAMLE